MCERLGLRSFERGKAPAQALQVALRLLLGLGGLLQLLTRAFQALDQGSEAFVSTRGQRNQPL